MRILGVVSSSSREVPNAPTIGTATDVGTGRAFNNGAATVTFTAPTFDGGLPITGYTVTSSPGGFTATGAASPLTVTGLQSGTAYTFTVVATNARGNSAASAASNSITATTVPQAPTIGSATAGNATATVTFTGNATGGKAISTYTATSSPGSITGSSASSPITVSGLTNGTAYTFTVTATNANGTSTASAASNSVTPAVPSAFDSIVTANIAGQSTVTISNIPNSYKHLALRFTSRGSTQIAEQLQINGISGATQYGVVTALSFQYGSFIFEASNNNRARLGNLTGNSAAGMITWFPNYTLTNQFRTLTGYAGGLDTVQDGANGYYGSYINTTSALSSITVFTNSGTMQGTNASLSLYGIA